MTKKQPAPPLSSIQPTLTSQSKDSENFDVIISTEIPIDNTTIITSSDRGEKWLEQAMSNYNPDNKIYSAYLNDSGVPNTTLTPEMIDNLALNPQSNLQDILAINGIIRKYINLDDMIGKTYETIESNVNTSFKISYNDFSDNRNKNKTLERAKSLIDDFNSKINIQKFLRSVAPTTYSEGTYCVYLRNDNGNYVVDYYPLGVAIVSDYDRNGEPYLLIDIRELTSRLRKLILKNKQGTPLFFGTVDEDIKNNYPKEVYDAYINRDQYIKLDIKYSGIIRTNNLNRKYGLTPIFRALKPMLMLETFSNTDRINSKAKAKKIIFQKLHKELMGNDYSRNGFEQMAYAHKNLLSAWQQPTVITTAPPFVESIEYIEPSTENTSMDSMTFYLKKMALALGIMFLNTDTGQTVSTANISIEELLKTINKIMEQAADVLNKWYRVILSDAGIDIAYAPTISINSSEEMNFEMRKSLSEFLFTKLSSSYNTAYSTIGIDIDDELQKRKFENEEGYSDIFEPHPLSFTTANPANETDNKGGTPKPSTNLNKKDYDKTRQVKK